MSKILKIIFCTMLCGLFFNNAFAVKAATIRAATKTAPSEVVKPTLATQAPQTAPSEIAKPKSATPAQPQYQETVVVESGGVDAKSNATGNTTPVNAGQTYTVTPTGAAGVTPTPSSNSVSLKTLDAVTLTNIETYAGTVVTGTGSGEAAQVGIASQAVVAATSQVGSAR